MTNEPKRYHIFLPQGKSWSMLLRYPVGFDLSGYSHRLRIRSSFTKDKVITDNGLEVVDASVSTTLNQVVISINSLLSTSLRGNCNYDELPLDKDLRVNISSLQSKSITSLPGRPYVYEIEVENPLGNVDAILFGGIIVPHETNRGSIA